MTTITMPELAHGETYAGLILKEDGTPSHHVILLPGDNDDATWEAQMEWANSVGGELPTRKEQSLLFANCKQHFKRDCYWSCEAPESGWAWCQDFYGGRQGYDGRYGELRARAVRRLPI